jgi:import inner membrane translocase subunit TIM54
MVAPNVEGTPPARPLEPQYKSGVRSVLEFTGIPTSWLSKRPKLPSRNWLIFLTFTSSLTGLYVYDRRQCKRIRREYVDRVKHLADEPIDSMEWLRKVTVYGSKWPGDEEYDRSMKYFRKYVKVCVFFSFLCLFPQLED